MGVLYRVLKEHAGRTVSITEYGNGANFALEDLDTNEIMSWLKALCKEQ